MIGGRHLSVVCIVALAALAAMACSYAAGDEDRAYLSAFCSAVDQLSDSLVSGDPAAALEEFHGELTAIEPPSRLARFHHDFIAYVEAVSMDPARITRREAPRPDSETRAALAAVEDGIEECWHPTFFETSSR